MGALFKNPGLQPEHKATVLEWLAVYYANVLGDLPAASRVANEAMELAPADWRFRLRVVEVLIEQHDWVSSKRVAGALPASLDTWTRYTEPKLAERFVSAQQKLHDAP